LTITGLIFNIQRFSINDGPGIRTTVFLKGCPLHCPWCHNPESLSPKNEIALRADRCVQCGDCYEVCKNHAILKADGSYSTLREKCLICGDCVDVCVSEGREMIGKEMTTGEVLEEIKKDTVFYLQSGGGATFSGGEPFMQHEFLISSLRACQQEGIHTAVDTTGYTSPSILERVAQYTDFFLYDLKTMDDDRHQLFTGVSNQYILKNLCLLAGWKKQIVVRVPIIPGFNDDEKNILAIGNFISRLGTIREMQLIPYHESGIEKYRRLGMEYSMTYATPPDREKLNRLVEIARGCVPLVALGG
jgi:pyruvate formate lyase activating enzyme